MYSAERGILGKALIQSDSRTITNWMGQTILQMAAGKRMPHLQNYIFFYAHLSYSYHISSHSDIQLLALICYAHAHFHARFIVPATCMHTVTQQPHSHSFPLSFSSSFFLIYSSSSHFIFVCAVRVCMVSLLAFSLCRQTSLNLQVVFA